MEFRDQKGSLTVETALVFPLVVYSVLLIIFIVLILFCRVNTAIAINRVCDEVTGTYYDAYGKYGAYYNNGPSGGVITEAISETLRSRTRKEDTIEKRLKSEIERSSPVKITAKPEVKITNCFIWQSIDVKVKVDYPVIMGGLFDFFSNDPRFNNDFFKETQTRSLVVSSSESNIRTIDYIGEKVKNSKVTGTISNTVDKIKKKVGEIFK